MSDPQPSRYSFSYRNTGYELPSRHYTVLTYPISSPNGSSIILCAHETGVRITWHGGKPLKNVSTPVSTAPKVNGTSTSNVAVVILDIDGGEQTTKQAEQLEKYPDPEYDSEEEESDSSKSYCPFVQHADLILGTAVLALSIPPIPRKAQQVITHLVPDIFTHRVIFTAACADGTVRVLTLPIAPPTETRSVHANVGALAEHIITLSPQPGYQGIPDGIATTCTSTETIQDTETEQASQVSEVDLLKRNRKLSRLAHRTPGCASDQTGWELIVASHSVEAAGVLFLYSIPIDLLSPASASSGAYTAPFQVVYLDSPARSITFSTAAYPSATHLQLLVVNKGGFVGVYEPMTRPIGSKLDNGVATWPNRGTWIASFASPFQIPAGKEGFPRIPVQRSGIIDAKWVLAGRAILVLLADGEWAVWDFQTATDSEAVHSRSPTSIGGFLPGTTGRGQQSPGHKADGAPNFAPKTPKTRRAKEESLFQGSSEPRSVTGGASTGGVVISMSTPADAGVTDEVVVIWYNASIYIVPSFDSFWRHRRVDKTAVYHRLFSRLEIPDTHEEYIKSVVFLPAPHPSASRAVATHTHLLVRTDRRLIDVTEKPSSVV